MISISRATICTLLVYGLAANCMAQIEPTNPGLKNWFSLVGLDGTGTGSWVSDLAGVQGTAGFNSNDISALSAFLHPAPPPFLSGVKTDHAGNVYFADTENNQIRMIQAGTGTIMVVAGSGNTSCTDGTSVAPLEGNLYYPTGLAIDALGNLYVSEYGNDRIRVISADRTLMTTIAGTCTAGYNGSAGGVNAANAELNGPMGIAIDSRGYVVFADYNNNRVRLIAGSSYGATIYDIAGTGLTSFVADPQFETGANLYGPVGVAIDLNDAIYITEYNGQRIRMIYNATTYTIGGVNGTAGNTCSVDGTIYYLYYNGITTCPVDGPTGIAVNGYGDIVYSDSNNQQIKVIISGLGFQPPYSTPILGTSLVAAYTGTPSNGRNFWKPYVSSPTGIDIDLKGRIRFFDSGNDVVRLWRAQTPLIVQTTDNTQAYEYFYQYDGANTSYRYPSLTLPQQRTLTVGGGATAKLVGTGDFNRDGDLDLVWEDTVTHQVTIWYQTDSLLTGAFGAGGTGGCPCTLGFQEVALEGSPQWHVVAVADFNGDGVPDLVFQNTTTSEVVIWNMTGPWGNLPLSLTYAPGTNNAPWVVVGAADFNGDGTPDLLWQDPNNAQMLVWYMTAQGASLLNYALLNQAPSGWTCIGTNDFDGNGTPDIYYQNNTTAAVLVWLMGGTTGTTNLNQVGLEFAPPTNWRYMAR
jgi:hypothetical protein